LSNNAPVNLITLPSLYQNIKKIQQFLFIGRKYADLLNSKALVKTVVKPAYWRQVSKRPPPLNKETIDNILALFPSPKMGNRSVKKYGFRIKKDSKYF
jgi:hypothetical protein